MKKILVVFALLFIVAFAGCKGEKKSSLENPFIGGTTGVVLSFDENAPPAEAYAGGENPFDVVVKIKNDGEYTIPKENAVVTLSGMLASEFGKLESELVKKPSEDIEARKKDNGKVVDSNPVYVEFTGLNRKEDFSGATYPIKVDVCYKYETQAISKICVKRNNLDKEDGVCIVSESKDIFNSGAPVQITSLTEDARAKDKISFSFTVSHKANGKVFKRDSLCGKESTRANEDIVWVEVKSGLDGLSCTGLRDGSEVTGFATLYGGEKLITCTQTVTTSSDYEKPIEIKVLYDYDDSKETSVIIKSSNG